MTQSQSGADYVDWVLDQLFGMFGVLFARDNQVAVAGGGFELGDRAGLWAAELARVRPEHLAIGLNRFRDRIRAEASGGDKCWPPTAVQFAAACQPAPEDLGFVSEDRAWLLVCELSRTPERVTCPAVKAAASGLWPLIRTESRNAEKAFRKAYAGVLNRAMAGEDITPRQQLEHQKPVPVPVIDRLKLTPEQQAAASAMANRMKRLSAMRRGAA